MYSLMLLSLYSTSQLIYKNCFRRGLRVYKKKMLFIKKNYICKEKSATVTKAKLVTKMKTRNQLSLHTFW